MSGTAIIRSLLAAHAPVTAIVPINKIISGTVAQGTVLPAISVRSVSANEQWTTANNLPVKMVRERIQVTVYGRTFVEMERILKACALGRGVYTGTVATFPVRSIMREAIGPYIEATDDNIHEQSRDFMVTFMEAN